MRRDLVSAAIAGVLAIIIGAISPAAAEPRSEKGASEPVRMSPDQAFLAARAAFLKRDARALEAAASQARGHLLGDYLDYWQLSLKLRAGVERNSVTEREIERMLERHAGAVSAALLRRQWLETLAAREQWAQFDKHYALQELPPETGLRCQRALSTAKQPQGRVTRETIDTLLMVPRELVTGCQRLLDHLVQTGQFDTKDAEKRVYRALESGNIAAIRQSAPAVGLPAEDLKRGLAVANAEDVQASRWTALIALNQLARTDPARAARLLGRGHVSLRPQDREFLWSQIAATGMKRMLPEAHAWARLGARAPVSDETLAWQARAALRAHDWLLLGTLIDRMSAPARQDPAWAYWAARSLAERGQRTESQRQLSAISSGFDFYGLLAREDLGQTLRLPARIGRPLEAAEIEAVDRKPGLKRALRFYALGLRVDGHREWNQALRGLNDRQLLAVATWACRRGLHDRCVNTAERTREEHDFELRFIMPFGDEVHRASAERGLDPAWVYGLIRQESRFIPDIRSSAGAQGLMQIMPATGKWIAGKLEQRNFRLEQLHEPRTNIRFGTYYLRNVLDGLDGSPVLASAGYNAGPGRPQRWRETLPNAVEGEVFAAIIPFDETRDYVKKVLANATVYSMIMSGQPQSIRAWLGKIGPQQTSPNAVP